MQLTFPPLLGIRPGVLAGCSCDSPTPGITEHPTGDGLFKSAVDAPSSINCLTLFILLTKETKMMNSALHEVQQSSKTLRKSIAKVSSPLQVQQVDWQSKPGSLSGSQPHLSTRQGPCSTRSYCSNTAEETKRTTTKHQVNCTNKKVICPQEQHFYLPTVTIHFAARQETLCGWHLRPTSLSRGFRQLSFTQHCNSPQAQHKVSHCV